MLGRLLGKIVAAPVRLANVPIRAIEKVGDHLTGDEDRTLSVPLESVAEAIEEALDLSDDE